MYAQASYSIGLRALAKSFINNRALIKTIAKRDVFERYKASTMGLLWSLLTPLFLLSAYTAVFGGIFRTRWGGSGSTSEFALNLFCGLLLHTFLSDCLTQSSTKLIIYSNYVKKVVFPLEILPVVVVINALFHAAISILILLAAKALLFNGLSLSVLALPLVLAPLVVLALGFSWFLSALTVYIRDVAQVVPLFTMLLLFLSPIFYPVSMVPEAYQGFIAISPLTVPVEGLRSVLLLGEFPNWTALSIYSFMSFIFMWFGFAWFQKTRKGFADVL